MSIGLWIAIAVGIIAGTVFMYVLARAWLLEQREERLNPTPEWDASARVELLMMRHQQEKDRKRCPGCNGTRCYDWNEEGRSCAENPTVADGTGRDPLREGRHQQGKVRLVPDGWWPIPQTLMGRTHPHLWALVADHAQILVTCPRKVALP